MGGALQAAHSVLGWRDKHRLDQVLTNLLSNALKYGEGKPVWVGLAATEKRARFFVRDEGIVWISRQVVEAHGGRSGVESSPGSGATFFVELPWTAPRGAEPGPVGSTP
jgi:signal transduction histidine kinase